MRSMKWLGTSLVVLSLFFGLVTAALAQGSRYDELRGKGFFVVLRLYGPTQPFFAQTWKPGDVEKVQ